MAAITAAGIPVYFVGVNIYGFFKKNKPTKTIIDIETIEDAEYFMKKIVRPDESADEIFEKIVKIFSTFFPCEKTLQQLSIMQQKYEKTGGRQDYIITTLHLATITAINDFEEQKNNSERLLSTSVM